MNDQGVIEAPAGWWGFCVCGWGGPFRDDESAAQRDLTDHPHKEFVGEKWTKETPRLRGDGWAGDPA